MPELPKLRPILVVDDDENDIFLMRRALERACILNPVVSVRSGTACMAYLRGDPPFADRREFPLPTLVLLDLRMPGLDGLEVLSWIRSHPGFEKTCVMMLSSSQSAEKSSEAYRLGVDSFLVKPMDVLKAPELMQTIQRLLERC